MPVHGVREIRGLGDAAPAQSYRVVDGDSLTLIAQKLGYCDTNATVAGAQVCLGMAKRIAAYNNIPDMDKIEVDQLLLLPPDLSGAPPATQQEVLDDAAKFIGAGSRTDDVPQPPVAAPPPVTSHPSVSTVGKVSLLAGVLVVVGLAIKHR